MKKHTTFSIFGKLVLFFLSAAGIILLLSLGKQQKAQSKPNLEQAAGTDDDEPLSNNCGGVERWDVKVFTDAAANKIDFAHPHLSSVTHLVTLPTVTPTTYEARIQPQEDSVYTVICNITALRVESDSDYHLSLVDGLHYMIGEVPCPSCTSVAASPKISNFITCRNWVMKNIGSQTNYNVSIPKVQITGVSYYDPPHSQSDAAPNNMEIHSIIAIQFASNGIVDLANNYNIHVYPNPNNGEFTMEVNSNTLKANTQVEFYNLFGQEIYTQQLKEGNNTINLTGKAVGLCIYKIFSENGGFISSGKVLVQ